MDVSTDNKITRVHIDNFRHLKNIDVEIGERITPICGENGTGKSCLLGLIGHIFTFNEKKGIDNQLLETLFSEVFRFSGKNDIPGEHKYSIHFSDGTTKNAVSRSEEAIGRFRIDVGERTKGQGKIIRPVRYLGLKRLIPIAQESDKGAVFDGEMKLTEDEVGLYAKWHNHVLVMDDKIKPNHTKTKNKELYSPTTDYYDAYGNSAGQDNLAQIILAILSFKRLKEEMRDKYLGGVLLIDEVDATLYPAAQIKLLELFQKVSKDYNLQIIFTTHSTDILQSVRDKYSKDQTSKIIFLKRESGKIAAIQDKTKIDNILSELKHCVLVNRDEEKINVYFEDEEARIWFRRLVSSDIMKKIALQKTNLGCGMYKNLLDNNFPEFKKSVVVLDGDQRNEFKTRNKSPKVIFLPGLKSPENELYEFLENLGEDDVFWEKTIGGYSKAVFLNSRLLGDKNRDTMKKWFNDNKIHWGRGCCKIYKRWKESNEKEVGNFLASFDSALEKILK